MKSLWFAGLGEVQAYSQTRWEKEGIKKVAEMDRAAKAAA
jgi:hypothetical protein